MRTATLLAGSLVMIVAARAEAQPLPEPAGSTVEEVCLALGGCATCNADLEQCNTDLGQRNGELAQCNSDLGQRNAEIAQCNSDLGQRNAELTQCNSDLGQCGGDLTQCGADLETRDAELAECQACGDGNLDPWEECDAGAFGEATCDSETAGAMPFGELACLPGCTLDTSGCAPRFVDTGLTVIDNSTGLEWEKKTADATVHYLNNTYTWTESDGDSTDPDGTAFTEFLASLNACESAAEGEPDTGGFAGRCDWRLPQKEELLTIRDLSEPNCGQDFPPGPCIDPIFGPTMGYDYWTATTGPGFFTPNRNLAWTVSFWTSDVLLQLKGNGYPARAVRGGSQ